MAGAQATVKRLDGVPIAMDAWRAKLMLVNFWKAAGAPLRGGRARVGKLLHERGYRADRPRISLDSDRNAVEEDLTTSPRTR